LNNDGANDVISGPWWWEGPGFTTRQEYYPARATFKLKLGPMSTVEVPGFEGTLGRENKYSDNFFAWPYDFNKDGWKDTPGSARRSSPATSTATVCRISSSATRKARSSNCSRRRLWRA